VSESLERMIRAEGGRVLATLVRLTGDLTIAEDAVQDAVVEALARWPLDGPPRNPAAWLTTVARNRALDVLRREARRRAKEAGAALLDDGARFGEVTTDSMVRDDQLRLLFSCCHPALAIEGRVALSLRILCGLSTAEIAAVFLQAEATIGQRISRAKRKIAVARIPYRIPDDHELPDRLPAVMAVIHAVLTAGHHAPHGPLTARLDLAADAVRLSRLLHELMPDEPEATGLLALSLATHARRSARLDADGAVVLMADQDRSLWRHDEIAEAAALLDHAVHLHRPGPFQVQAAIACLHGLAPSIEATDWRQIADLYTTLERMTPTPAVRVNRAVAVAEVDGAGAGLDLLAELDPAKVERWHLYWSTLAELSRRAGRPGDAVRAFDQALQCSPNDSDREFLFRRRSLAAAEGLHTA
jgi:RNA polymerase sigma-70 factor (ECF subfamily)